MGVAEDDFPFDGEILTREGELQLSENYGGSFLILKNLFILHLIEGDFNRG